MSDPGPQALKLGNGRYAIVTGTQRGIAYAIRNGGDIWMFVDGQVHVLGATATTRRSSGPRDQDLALAAPMPATVAAIHVEAGQQVSGGDALVTLEAMKMELTVKAPRDGRIRAIACRAGDLVQPGVPLIEME